MKEVARALLETGAILINPERRFKLVSGRLSPVYVDCRRLISFPEARETVVKGFTELVEQEIGLEQVEVIAGGETAGIPFAAFLSQRLGRPMIYVRKEPKGHGRGDQSQSQSQIEGVLEPGRRVLLVEDLVTDGGSKLRFKEGIERAGGIVEDCLTVFEYFSERAGLRRARETLAEHGLRLHSLTNWDEVLQLALAEGQDRLSPSEIAAVLEFLREF
ncbi:TPA: orotate phosphoribosyltransferase [Candidatus Bipolaricaulota bacterium]|nr:orotate phosphoribosyltransferase [Candidatus Bipolaricaulota bacterium]